VETGPKRKVHGVCVHTTGDGIPSQAHTKGEHVLVTARRVYENMGTVGPHFIIDPAGTIEQYADPTLVRHHVGLEPEHRRSFLDGHWKEDANRIDRKIVAWWEVRWPGIKSPSHLYPSKSANEDYIGIELIPAGRYVPRSERVAGGWTFDPRYSKPGFDNQRFSVEQYTALVELLKRLEVQFNLDYVKPGVLVGHEDINPYTRPGWDPGDYNKTFSWGMVKGLLGK
jgi:N-acetyl-anhydromuramyl-L-alanine amidase AmpD